MENALKWEPICSNICIKSDTKTDSPSIWIQNSSQTRLNPKGLIDIIKRASGLGLIVDGIEFRVAQFTDQWLTDFKELLNALSLEETWSKEIKSVYIKLGRNCSDSRGNSKIRWDAFESLTRPIIKGETYASKPYEENGIRIYLSDTYDASRPFFTWLQTHPFGLRSDPRGETCNQFENILPLVHDSGPISPQFATPKPISPIKLILNQGGSILLSDDNDKGPPELSNDAETYVIRPKSLRIMESIMESNTKTPKSQLKELQDKYKSFGATLLVFDSTADSSNATGEFEFTCVFTKSTNGYEFKGTGTGKSKKAAEHSACQRVLDLLQKDQYDIMQNLPDLSAGSPQQAFVPKEISPIKLVPNQVSPPTIRDSENKHKPQLLKDDETYAIKSPRKVRNYNMEEPELTTIPVDDEQLDSPEMLQRATENNSIGDLKEFCEKGNIPLPVYTDIRHWIGKDNSNKFKVKCTVGDANQFGIATVKMNAKKIAAFKILETIRSMASPTVIASINRGIRNIDLTSISAANPAPNRPCTKVTDKTSYYLDALLGEGATSRVFEGTFENRRAAVKICLRKDIYHEQNKELDIMRKLNNPNLVTYYITEDIGPTYTYVVMELASTTLENIIINNSTENLDLPLKKWSTDMVMGLVALHGHKIVHRDIKPGNVLIFPGDLAKLANFGISKELDSITEGMITEAHKGTRIYMPTEGLKAIGSNFPFILKPSYDIFSLGLTIFFAMSGGKHLFAFEKNESPFRIQFNILEYRPNFGWLSEIEWTSLKNLLQAMINIEPNLRPTAATVLEHPFFWDDKKGLDFIEAVNNDFENIPNSLGFAKTEMVNMYERFCNENKGTKLKNWKTRLCVDVQNFMTYKDQMRKTKQVLQTKKYTETSFMKLIEFIQDYNQHFDDWKSFEGGKLLQDNIFGYEGSKYGSYFLNRFPELTTCLYCFFQDKNYRDLQISRFYTMNTTECFPKY